MGACSSKPKTLEYEGSMEPTEKAAPAGAKEISTVATDIASEKTAAQKLELLKDAVAPSVESEDKKEKKESETKDLTVPDPASEAIARSSMKQECAVSKDEEETRDKSMEKQEKCLQSGTEGVGSEEKDDEAIHRSLAPAPANESSVVKDANEGVIQADTMCTSASNEAMTSEEKEAEIIGSENEDIELISDKVVKAMAECESTKDTPFESTVSDKAGDDAVETIEGITNSSSIEEHIASDETDVIAPASDIITGKEAEKVTSDCINGETVKDEKVVESLDDQTAKTASDDISFESIKDADAAESSYVVVTTPSNEKQSEPATFETVQDTIAESSDVVSDKLSLKSIEEVAVQSSDASDNRDAQASVVTSDEIPKDTESSDVVVCTTPADVLMEKDVTPLSDETKYIPDIVTEDAKEKHASEACTTALEEKHILATDKDAESLYVDKTVAESCEGLVTTTADVPSLYQAVDTPSKVVTETVGDKDTPAASCQVETITYSSEVISSSEETTEAGTNVIKEVGTSSVISADNVHDAEAKTEEKISTENGVLENQEKVGSEIDAVVAKNFENTTKDQTTDSEPRIEPVQSEPLISTITSDEAKKEKPIDNVVEGRKQIIQPTVDNRTSPEETNISSAKKQLDKLNSSLSDVFEDALDEPLKIERTIPESEVPEQDLKPEVKTTSRAEPENVQTTNLEAVPCEEPSK